MVTARIPMAIPIQATDQIKAGMPVAFAMFTASVGTVGPKGEDRKKTVFKSSRALSTHWIARKLTRNVATRGRAYFATATSPTLSSVPAKIVKGSEDVTTPDMAGLISP